MEKLSQQRCKSRIIHAAKITRKSIKYDRYEKHSSLPQLSPHKSSKKNSSLTAQTSTNHSSKLTISVEKFHRVRNAILRHFVLMTSLVVADLQRTVGRGNDARLGGGGRKKRKVKKGKRIRKKNPDKKTNLNDRICQSDVICQQCLSRGPDRLPHLGVAVGSCGPEFSSLFGEFPLFKKYKLIQFQPKEMLEILKLTREMGDPCL